MKRNNNDSQEEEKEESEVKINRAVKRRFELEIERERDIAKCSKRWEGKLRELLKLKEKQKEQEATHIEKMLKG